MPQPYNYTLDVQSPFSAAVEGLKLGATFADVQAQQEQNRLKQLEMQRAAAQQQYRDEQIRGLMSNPNPTARDFANIAMLLPEKEAASMRSNWDMLNKDQQDNELRFGGQVMSAFISGKNQVGIDMLLQRAEAERNAGREDRAKAFETYAQLAEVNPSAAQKTIGVMIAGVPGGDKVLESSIKAISAPVELQGKSLDVQKKAIEVEGMPEKQALEGLKTRAEIRNIDSQISERGNRLGLDRDKLQSDIELSLYKLGQSGEKLDADARKLVNESTIKAVSSEQSAGRMLDLAARIEKAEGGKGNLTKASEWFAKATGRQDEWSMMRNEYVRLKNSEAIKALPPGPATDKDIEIAMKGFPDEAASAETLSGFLRGMAKMQKLDSAAENAKAEWVNATGTLGRAKQDMEVAGIRVPAGSSFVDFIRQYGSKLSENVAAPQTNAVIQGASYSRWATGGAQAAPKR